MSGRYVTPLDDGYIAALQSTPSDSEMEAGPEQYRLYRLCVCPGCGGTGKLDRQKCQCRGEGRILQLVATCGTKEAVGVALVTLAEEGEWDECPFGLLHRPAGERGRWLLKPWGPSARNVSDAGRLLRAQR